MIHLKPLIFLLLCSTAVFGQSVVKTGVKFTCTCEDNLGARYATAVRDLIASSPRYELASEFSGKNGTTPFVNWGIRVVSVDPSAGNNGNDTVLSVVITLGQYYLTHSVQYCTSARVKDCAANAIALLDGQVSN